MRSDRVIPKQNVIINVSIQFILGIIRMLINQLTFQRIEIPFNGSIIISQSCSCFAWYYDFTIHGEVLWCKLRALIAVENYPVAQHPWVLSNRIFNRLNCRLSLKAIPRKDRLPPLPRACLHIFRYLAQKLLEIRRYSCVTFVQANEKSDCAITRQSLCGIALEPVQYLPAHVFLANFASDSPKNPWNTRVFLRIFRTVCDKIVLKNPHTVKYWTGS